MIRAKINLLVLIIGVFPVACTESNLDSKEGETHEHTSLESYYTCSMHPQIRSDKPGKCPICYMNLTKVEIEKEDSSQVLKKALEESSTKLYHCSSFPEITSQTADICPIDGSAMIEKKKKSLTTSEVVARIKLKKSQLNHFKPEYFPVTRMKMAKLVRILGSVVAAEENESSIPARVPGRVESVNIVSTGSLVRKGDPVLTLYSPELIAAGEEYALAAKSYIGNKSKVLKSLLDRSKERLELWGVKSTQYESWVKEGRVPREITIHSNASGIVRKRNAQAGKYFKVGEDFFNLSDLSSVWVEFDIYEQDVGLVSIGQDVRLNFVAIPGQLYETKIDFISPTLNSDSRTLKVRATIANPDGMLRPGMVADSKLSITLPGTPLVVPRNAIIDTGVRKVVWIKTANHSFQAKTIRTGQEAQGYVEVLSGLTEQNSVVTEGNFLLDAQAQLFGGYTDFKKVDPHAGHQMKKGTEQ